MNGLFCTKIIIMKKILLSLTVCLAVTCFQQVKAQTPEEQKRWMDYMTPSEVHKMIASWNGEWKEEITMWMAPGDPGQKMDASCVNNMVLDGRYQESKHTGDFGGMPFHGISILAYDNVTKNFVNTWIDNFGTGMMILKGTWDAATKTINLKGEMTDPMSGTITAVRQTLQVIDDNTQLMIQYGTKDGKEFKNMEIKLTRKK